MTGNDLGRFVAMQLMIWLLVLVVVGLVVGLGLGWLIWRG